MTWPLVIMRVNRQTYEDIKARVIAANQADRIFHDGRISVDELAIEIDPEEDISSSPEIGDEMTSQCTNEEILPLIWQIQEILGMALKKKRYNIISVINT